MPAGVVVGRVYHEGTGGGKAADFAGSRAAALDAINSVSPEM